MHQGADGRREGFAATGQRRGDGDEITRFGRVGDTGGHPGQNRPGVERLVLGLQRHGRRPPGQQGRIGLSGFTDGYPHGDASALTGSGDRALIPSG